MTKKDVKSNCLRLGNLNYFSHVSWTMMCAVSDCDSFRYGGIDHLAGLSSIPSSVSQTYLSLARFKGFLLYIWYELERGGAMHALVSSWRWFGRALNSVSIQLSGHQTKWNTTGVVNNHHLISVLRPIVTWQIDRLLKIMMTNTHVRGNGNSNHLLASIYA